MTAATAAGARLRRPADDDGFTLIEVVVALVLTIIVMTTTAGFFIRGIAATRLMQQRQSAVAVAEQAVERVRAEPVAALVAGVDTTVTGGGTLTATTDPAYRVGKTDYTVRTRINTCGLPAGGDACGSDTSPANLLMLRVNVTVTWSPPVAARCSGPSTQCEYSVSTLMDPAGNSPDRRLKEVPTVTP